MPGLSNCLRRVLLAASVCGCLSAAAALAESPLAPAQLAMFPGSLQPPAPEARTQPLPPGLPADLFERHERSILDVTPDIAAPEGEMPADPAAERFNTKELYPFDALNRPWESYQFHWLASGMCHRPLYFEDPNLERYGHAHCCPVQAALSAAHFWARIPALPYLMVTDPPCTCRYALGYYRPGNCAPKVCDLPPPKLDAAAVQGGVITGLIFLVP